MNKEEAAAYQKKWREEHPDYDKQKWIERRDREREARAICR